MREFNYVRAHAEWAEPRFQALSPLMRRLFADVERMAPALSQAKDLSVQFPDDYGGRMLRELFEPFTSAALAEAAFVVDKWGHWGHIREVEVRYGELPPRTFVNDWRDPFSPGREAKAWVESLDDYGPSEVQYVWRKAGETSAGSHWKFKLLVDTVLKQRGVPEEADEKRLAARLGWDTSEFMDHVPGTPWSLAELPALFMAAMPEGSPFVVRDAVTVNHKPHPYTIGRAHMSAARGFIDEALCARVPCAYPGCNKAFAQHTSERALVVGLRDASASLEEAKQQLPEWLPRMRDAWQPLWQEHKIDGLVLGPSR